MAAVIDYEALLALLRARRSVRRFGPAPIDDATLDKLVEAARWAPSASNRQGYRLIAVRDHVVIAALRRAVNEAGATLAAGAPADRAADLAAYLEHFDHFGGAPLVLAQVVRKAPDLLAGLGGGDGAANAPEGTIPRPLIDALSSSAAALMNLLLAAETLGLGACWMTGPLIAGRALEELLAVPRGWALTALLPLGYPDERPRAPPRREVKTLLRYHRSKSHSSPAAPESRLPESVEPESR